jgi:hypothetical protein
MKFVTLGVAGLLGLGLLASQAVAMPYAPTTKPEAAREAKDVHHRKSEAIAKPQTYRPWKGGAAEKARDHRAGRENGLRERLHGRYPGMKARQTRESMRKSTHTKWQQTHQCPYAHQCQ